MTCEYSDLPCENCPVPHCPDSMKNAVDDAVFAANEARKAFDRAMKAIKAAKAKANIAKTMTRENEEAGAKGDLPEGAAVAMAGDGIPELVPPWTPRMLEVMAGLVHDHVERTCLDGDFENWCREALAELDTLEKGGKDVAA